jgi:exoribonuclease-2
MAIASWPSFIPKERESAEPEELIEPFLTRFVGKVQRKDDRLSIVPDHPC